MIICCICIIINVIIRNHQPLLQPVGMTVTAGSNTTKFSQLAN